MRGRRSIFGNGSTTRTGLTELLRVFHLGKSGDGSCMCRRLAQLTDQKSGAPQKRLEQKSSLDEKKRFGHLAITKGGQRLCQVLLGSA